MNKFKIHFIGLICHVGNSETNKTHAAMVRDDEHVAGVILRNMLYDLEQADAIRFRMNGKLEDPYYAVTNIAFDKFVPSIQSVMGGMIQPDLVPLAVTIHYPPGHDKDGNRRPGTLSVARLYHDFGVHRIGGVIKRPTDRVARQIVLEIESPYPELEIVEVKGNDMKTLGSIGKDGSVLFGNIADGDWDYLQTLFAKKYGFSQPMHEHREHEHREHEHGHGGAGKRGSRVTSHADLGHFRKFGALLSGENNTVTVDQIKNNAPEAQSGITDWVDIVMEALDAIGATVATHVECGNTDYP